MALKTHFPIALAAVLTACGPVNRGLESVHQPIVQRTDYVIDVATAGTRLAPGEQERLDGWFRSIELSYGDRVALDGASGAAERDVAALLGRRGLGLTGTAPMTAGEIAPGAVRVVVSRASASVPGCPDWRRPAAPEFSGSTMSNYGCAANAALASMVADPMDLVQGRGSGTPTDPLVSSRAIDTYRTLPPTSVRGIKVETTSKVGR